jgi:hypothetical protein
MGISIVVQRRGALLRASATHRPRFASKYGLVFEVTPRDCALLEKRSAIAGLAGGYMETAATCVLTQAQTMNTRHCKILLVSEDGLGNMSGRSKTIRSFKPDHLSHLFSRSANMATHNIR